jgi:hypothetical protein
VPFPVDQRKPILAGDLSDFDVRSLMSAFSLGRQVMTIEVLNTRGGCEGRIVMQGGRVLSASAAGQTGAGAVRHLLQASRTARFQVLREAPEAFSRVQHIGTLAEVTGEQGDRLREAARPRTRVMEGSLSDFDVATILQVVSTARQHTVMEVVDLAGARVGAIQLKAGMVVSAEAGTHEGVAAIRQLLRAPASLRFAVFREADEGAELPLVGPLDEVLLRAATEGPPPPPRRSGVHRAVPAPQARPEQSAHAPSSKQATAPVPEAATVPMPPPASFGSRADPRASTAPCDGDDEGLDLEDEVTTINDRRSLLPDAPQPATAEVTPVLDGSLRDFDLCSVLQVAGISRQLTSVRIFDEQRQPVGEVRLQGGQIVAVSAPGQRDLAALRLLLHAPRDFLFSVVRHAQQPSGLALTALGSVIELLQQASVRPPVSDDELRFGAQAASVLPDVQRQRRRWTFGLGTGLALAAAAALWALRAPGTDGDDASIRAQAPSGAEGAAPVRTSPAASTAAAAVLPAPVAPVDPSEVRPSAAAPRVEPIPAGTPIVTPAAERGRPQVASMQGGLKLLGFHPGPVDGVIGPLTRAAIAAFQRAEGLRDDGELSAPTEARLYERIRAPRSAEF